MTTDQLLAKIDPDNRRLTAVEFQALADVPPEVEWFANLSNPSTRRAYENAVRDLAKAATEPCRGQSGHYGAGSSPANSR